MSIGMLLLILFLIIWTIYIIKCSYDRFHNIGKVDNIWRYDKDKRKQDIIIIE